MRMTAIFPTLLAATSLPLAWAAPAAAKDGALTVDLAIRVRGEAIDGQFRPNLPPSDAALLLRTQLSAEYDAGPVRIGGELIDSRAYFERRRSSIATTEVNALEPVQAYLKTDLGGPVQAQFGRFTMNLGSRRLVSRSVFRNTTNAFTGARIDFAPRSGDKLTLFWTMPQTRLPDDAAGLRAPAFALDRERVGLQFFGASLTSRPIAGMTIEAYLYRLAEQDAPGIATRDRRIWAPGLRLYQKPAAGKTDFDVEAIWEGGRTRASAAASDTTDLPVSAWALHAGIGRSLKGGWATRLSASVDYASGDGPGRHYTRFDPLFGARVFEFGPTSLYGPVSRQNFVAAEARAEFSPSKRIDGYFAVRPLWLASATDSFAATGVRDPLGLSGHYAGTQIDGRARFWIKPDRARLGIGYAHLFKGSLLNEAPNAPRNGDSNYGFTELTLTL